LSDSMRQWYGYVVLKQPFTSSEIVVMTGGSSAGSLPAMVHDEHDGGFRLPKGTGCC
jgi:carbon starvation protein